MVRRGVSNSSNPAKAVKCAWTPVSAVKFFMNECSAGTSPRSSNTAGRNSRANSCTILTEFRSEGRQMRVDTGFGGEVFHERMQRGNQSEIIQHCRAQFAGELMHDIDRVFHQLLGAFDVTVKSFGIEPGTLSQRGQADVDAGQSLGDDIMQLAADAFSLVFLRLHNLT